MTQALPHGSPPGARAEMDKSKARLVPPGVLLALDPTLAFVTNLAVGESATREAGKS